MFLFLYWAFFFFAAGRLTLAREVIVDDENTQITYTTRLPTAPWTLNYVCRHCGPSSGIPAETVRQQAGAVTHNGTWHTVRGGARVSNATLDFEGDRIAASFIVFKRDTSEAQPDSVTPCPLRFYIDGDLQAQRNMSWLDIATDNGQRDAAFIPNLLLFDRLVDPGPHTLTIQYDCGDTTERDMVLALDKITYWPEGGSLVGPSPVSATSSKPNTAAIIAGTVVGTLVFLALIGCAIFWWLKQRRQLPPAIVPTHSSFGEPPQASWNRLSDIDELTEISISERSSPEVVQNSRPRPPSAALSIKTLSTLSIFSRPGADLNGLPSPQAQYGRRSIRESFSSSFPHVTYGQQQPEWPPRPAHPYASTRFAAQR